MHLLLRSAALLFALEWSCPVFCGEIHTAVRHGDLENVKTLLKNNPDLVNSKETNYYDETPLFFATNKYMVDLLVANKADVNAKDKTGGTPLFRAVLEDDKEMVALLIASNADVNIGTGYSRTPLHAAAQSGYKDIAELLLAHKADVNAKDAEGKTPLDVVVNPTIFKDMIDLLRQHGGHE